MDRALIEQYAAGADRPAQAIVGLTPDELDRYPEPQTWSIREIILHLMDSDLISTYRMKRVIAEDNPPLLRYDEAAFARQLCYNQLNVTAATEVFRLNRRMMADILRRLPDAVFERSGLHNERGPWTLAAMIQTYVEHLEHHLRHVKRKRELLRNSTS